MEKAFFFFSAVFETCMENRPYFGDIHKHERQIVFKTNNSKVHTRNTLRLPLPTEFSDQGKDDGSVPSSSPAQAESTTDLSNQTVEKTLYLCGFEKEKKKLLMNYLRPF